MNYLHFTMLLSELKSGENGIITRVRGRGAFRRRIMEMGFIRGKRVEVIKNAPLNDPIEYSLLNYRVSLRRSESDLIEVESELLIQEVSVHAGAKESISEKKEKPYQSKIIEVAFVGNPNAGKTSLFNHASRSHEHTGNYSGVTVDSKTAHIAYNGYLIKVTDLPGTYSLSTISPEELFVREYITDKMPDVVVNVVDASNIERNLYLTTQMIDMDIRVVLALNMYDELEKREDVLDTDTLGKLLGMPIVPTVGSKGKGLKDLLDKIIDVFNETDSYQRHIHINFGDEIESSILKLQNLIKIPDNYRITDKVSSRFIAIKLLENDSHIRNYLNNCTNRDKIFELSDKERKHLELFLGEDINSAFTGKRYGFISGALLETFQKNQKNELKATEIIDSFLTHKLFGFVFFIFFMWLLFSATFKLGEYPKIWIGQGIDLLETLISHGLPEGSLKDLLIHGIIGGVGGVIVFLPNILILFLLISFMEDSGYMARAVFIMDKLMHKIGLHGKSFIPLIMGFGCNVPAIMATRTIEDRNSRLLTILINPFMSCSARLPVYLLLIGAIFPKNQGTMLFMLYLIGIAIAVLVAVIFKKLIFKSKGTPFVMELPPYRMPTARSIFTHMWFKGSQYLKKMGGVILLASVLLWALGYFPRPSLQSTHAIESSSVEHLENSYIGKIGKFIEPVMAPLGFDWKMGISLISGIVAKEVVVSTLGVLYRVDPGEDAPTENLAMKIKEEIYTSGPRIEQKVFNPIATISFLLFVLIYFPCIAVFAAVKNESHSIGWAFFMIFYTTTIAYLISLFVYQLGSRFLL
jgi:ferrous iron transport protein B